MTGFRFADPIATDRVARVLRGRARPRPEDAELIGRLVRQVLRAAGGPALRLVGEAVATSLTRASPRWERAASELWWGGAVVKRFRHDAANQRAVLDAFEERGWPPRIPDPLPRVAGLAAKVRRRETVRSLNSGLAPGTVRFYADGAGGILWCGVT